MRVDSKQNRASNSQLGKNNKSKRAKKNCFTNRKFSCKTKEITSKCKNTQGAWSNFEPLLQLPRKNTFTNISLLIHTCFTYLYYLTLKTSMRRPKLSRTHSKGSNLKTMLMDHATRTRRTRVPMQQPQRPDSDFSYVTVKSRIITLDFHQGINKISVCPGVN